MQRDRALKGALGCLSEIKRMDACPQNARTLWGSPINPYSFQQHSPQEQSFPLFLAINMGIAVYYRYTAWLYAVRYMPFPMCAHQPSEEGPGTSLIEASPEV